MGERGDKTGTDLDFLGVTGGVIACAAGRTIRSVAGAGTGAMSVFVLSDGVSIRSFFFVGEGGMTIFGGVVLVLVVALADVIVA